LRSWRSKSLLQHPLSPPVLLVAVIFAVYYPALLSGIHPIDDPGIFALYSSSPHLSAILLPGHSYYYRPIVELSFYLDNLLWGMEPGVMHLENILLHCANALLVYLLALRVFSVDETPIVPLLAALVFALHPVNVEAVTWIAGRTDPLLALFILSASYFWLRWLDKIRWQDMTATLLLFGVALLTKETALAFGAVAPLLALTKPGGATTRQRLMALSMVAAPGMLLIVFVLLFRSGSSGLSRFISGTELHVAQAVWQALIAFGFYVKKLIFPFPLNFAVNSVHPLYGLLGCALFPALWLVFRRYRSPGIFFISASFFILPAILVAVKQVAWTPFAERYLYMPTVFFALGLIGIAKTWHRKYPGKLMLFLVLLLCGSAIGIYQRNLLWKDPQSFFQDAVAKSPEFGSVHFYLGGILLQKGEIDHAEEAFSTADRLNKSVSMRYLINLSLMGTKLAKGDLLGTRTYFFQLYKKKQDAPADFLELLYKADGKSFEFLDRESKVIFACDLLETLGILNQKKPDPFWLYRSGQIALVTGKTVEAADFFNRAYNAAPQDAYYKSAAKTYYLRLKAK
jgi:protein O-mannosyl-transferase